MKELLDGKYITDDKGRLVNKHVLETTGEAFSPIDLVQGRVVYQRSRPRNLPSGNYTRELEERVENALVRSYTRWNHYLVNTGKGAIRWKRRVRSDRKGY